MKVRKQMKWVLLGAALLLILGLMLGCGEKEVAPSAPESAEQLSQWSMDSPVLKAAAIVQERHTPSLMKNAERGRYVINHVNHTRIYEAENPEEYKKLRKRAIANLRRAERDDAMRSLGLTKVRGAVSGRTYWE